MFRQDVTWSRFFVNTDYPMLFAAITARRSLVNALAGLAVYLSGLFNWELSQNGLKKAAHNKTAGMSVCTVPCKAMPWIQLPEISKNNSKHSIFSSMILTIIDRMNRSMTKRRVNSIKSQIGHMWAALICRNMVTITQFATSNTAERLNSRAGCFMLQDYSQNSL